MPHNPIAVEWNYEIMPCFLRRLRFLILFASHRLTFYFFVFCFRLWPWRRRRRRRQRRRECLSSFLFRVAVFFLFLFCYFISICFQVHGSSIAFTLFICLFCVRFFVPLFLHSFATTMRLCDRCMYAARWALCASIDREAHKRLGARIHCARVCNGWIDEPTHTHTHIHNHPLRHSSTWRWNITIFSITCHAIAGSGTARSQFEDNGIDDFYNVWPNTCMHDWYVHTAHTTLVCRETWFCSNVQSVNTAWSVASSLSLGK